MTDCGSHTMYTVLLREYTQYNFYHFCAKHPIFKSLIDWHGLRVMLPSGTRLFSSVLILIAIPLNVLAQYIIILSNSNLFSPWYILKQFLHVVQQQSFSRLRKFEDTKRVWTEEGQTIQCPKVKNDKDKQWPTKHYTDN